MPLTFEQGLQAQLDNDPKLASTVFGRRVKRILALPPTDKRRGRVLARMEAHARLHTGFKGKDWGAAAIDWKTILDLLIKILPLILALFGL